MICLRRDGPFFDNGEPQAEIHLTATLSAPRSANGLVLVVDAEGKSQPGPVQQAAADLLGSTGLATCLVDLLDPSEAGDQQKRFDIDLLTERLERVIEYLGVSPQTWRFPVGVFAVGTAAAAALTLASERPELVRAVISCCGRPDLAIGDPSWLTVPTLLIAPAKDATLLEANENFFLQVRCTRQLAIVRPPARQLTEVDSLAASARLVRQWCRRHIRRGARDAFQHSGSAARDARAGAEE